MNFFRRLSVSKRRRSDTETCRSRNPSNDVDNAEHASNQGTGRRTRTVSLGTVFSRNRSKTQYIEHYTTDFWERNFSEKAYVDWVEFRAAFILDYKHALEEFSDTGHLCCVLDAARDRLCNKESIVYINRYKRFVGGDPRPDAMWNKIKEDATRRLFEEAVKDSLCL